jgi:xylulokinase
VGGDQALAQRTGSRAFERFTAAQIRKFSKTEPAAYAATNRIHLVSSFLASLLTGGHAPIDPGDASGTNLMDLGACRWWAPAVDSTAGGLAVKLPAIAPASAVVGTLSPYWRKRHGLPAAKVIAWSGDNPCSLVGAGLVREGRIAVSLGTSDTVFGLMREPRVDRTGTGHVFGAPTGEYMGLTCFKNGSLARERIRDAFGLSWDSFSEALRRTPAGNHRRIMLPWFEPEITPSVPAPGVHRYGFSADDRDANVRGVIEGQQMAMALHSRWMNVTVDSIHATGGAAANRDILQVMADVFGAEVYQLQVGNSAALGAALRALHGGTVADGGAVSWDEVVKDFAEPVAASLLRPDASRHAVYRGLIDVYAACEAHALGRGGDPFNSQVPSANSQRKPPEATM